MGPMRTTAIIIPCFNEEQRLRVAEFAGMITQHPWLHFIFVNDGSTDRTLALIQGLSSTYERQIHFVDLGNNQGKAMAVWHGFHKAFADNYDNIGYWDADLATPLAAILPMCAQISGPDVVMVIGSRVRLLGRRIERQPLRHYLGRIFATVASSILGLSVYDTQCGAKIFRNNNTLQRVFSKPFSTRWIFDVEIFARFSLLQKHAGVSSLAATAAEYPLQEWHDVPGSKLTAWSFVKATYELAVIGVHLHFSGGSRRCQDMSPPTFK